MQVELDILQAISDGVDRPTRIMYRSNLSWSVMQNFLKVLETKGLVQIKEGEGRRSYSLSEKGQRVLQTYASVKKQIDIIEPIPA